MFNSSCTNHFVLFCFDNITLHTSTGAVTDIPSLVSCFRAMQPPQKSMRAFIRTRTASSWRLILLSHRFGEVHEDILQRRHLIRAMELRRQSGIHVIVRKLAVSPLRLALHLAGQLRRHHLLRAAGVRGQ